MKWTFFFKNLLALLTTRGSFGPALMSRNYKDPFCTRVTCVCYNYHKQLKILGVIFNLFFI